MDGPFDLVSVLKVFRSYGKKSTNEHDRVCHMRLTGIIFIGVSVAVPLIANFFFGVGSMLIFAMVTTMLTEFMPRRASNGVALNNFVRNIFSCVGGAVTDPLIVAIGNGWLFTMLGLLSLVSGVVSILAMKRYGDHWRITMDRKIGKVQGD